jgi:nitrite reductase/ring-hydroxylating ferredoxin subunit
MLRVCDAALVPGDAGLKVDMVGVGPVAVFRYADAYYVTNDRCTHGGASLSEGRIIGDEVECPFHMGAFNFRTGAVTARPCIRPLKTYPVTVIDGVIFITMPTGTPSGRHAT